MIRNLVGVAVLGAALAFTGSAHALSAPLLTPMPPVVSSASGFVDISWRTAFFDVQCGNRYHLLEVRWHPIGRPWLVETTTYAIGASILRPIEQFRLFIGLGNRSYAVAVKGRQQCWKLGQLVTEESSWSRESFDVLPYSLLTAG
jgi:hypothetical protein